MKRISTTAVFCIILTLFSTIQPASATVNSVMFSVNGGSDSSTIPATINVGDSVTVKIEIFGGSFQTMALDSMTAMPFIQISCDGDRGDATPCGSGPNGNNLYMFYAEAAASMTSYAFTFSVDVDTCGLPSRCWGLDSRTYSLSIVDPNAPVISSGDDSAAREAAEAARRAAVITAKATIVGTVNALKAPTLSDYRAADYAVNTQTTVDRINTQVLELQAKAPAAPLTELQIAPIIKKESFVEYVSTEATQGYVQARQLVENAVVAADYKYKASLLRVIKGTATTNLDSYAKIKALVDAEIARIQARKDRITALTKKLNG
jgi:hypothetical protein